MSFQGDINGGYKRQKVLPDIPKWEMECDFEPFGIKRRLREDFVDYRGVISQPLAHKIS